MFRILLRIFIFPIRRQAFRCSGIKDRDQCTSAGYCSVVIYCIKYITKYIFLLLPLKRYVPNLDIGSELALI